MAGPHVEAALPETWPHWQNRRVRNEQRLPTGTPQSRAFARRAQVVMGLTARLNTLPFDDLDARGTVLAEIFGGPVPGSLSILPPFYCDYGLGATFGERVFINQGCYRVAGQCSALQGGGEGLRWEGRQARAVP
ncbi:hypothetical protein GCM10010432_11510 [Catellatospora methionotrophica]